MLDHRHIKSLTLPILLALATVAQAVELNTISPDRVDASGKRLARVGAMLQEYVDTGKLAGAALHITKDGRVILHQAYGLRDRESGDPMRKDSIFRIASQTKAIVSVGIMILQEQGKLLIGQPLGDYLPEWSSTTVAIADEDAGYEVVPASRPITIRDLLTHTAGIGYGNGPASDQWREAGIQGWYFAHREEPIRETVRRMAALPMDAQPGQAFVYGYNTDILGALIEVVSGQTLDEFLRLEIIEPLDMVDTHFYLPEDKRERLTVVYSATEEGTLSRTPDVSAMIGQGAYVDGPRMSFSGGAGLLSTVRDYGRFLQMLANGGTLDGNRVIGRKTIELMTVDHLNGIAFRPGQGFGLGFSINKDLGARGTPGTVGEYAWGGAYHTSYWVDPAEGLVVVYMTQELPARGLDETAKLRALLYQALN